MTSFTKITIFVTCVAATCGDAVFWSISKENASDRKLVGTVRTYRVHAEQGDAKAQYGLGFMYYQGQGVPQDYGEAMRWYRKAAVQGDPTAQTALAYMYDRGQGVPQDYAEAVVWCRKAADGGDAMAQSYLGFSYAQGQGVPQDYAEAIRWYRRAANQGYANAQYSLGNMYRKGQGMPQNYAEAVRWYRGAADQGDRVAQYSLGFMYQKGYGVRQDDAEAVRWYRRAADQGDMNARRALVSMYCTGRGMPLVRWTSVIAIVLALLVLVVPQRRWGRAKWLPWALCSAICVILLSHQLVLSALSLAVLAIGPLWRAVFVALPGGGAAICAFAAVRVAMRGQATKPQAVSKVQPETG